MRLSFLVRAGELLASAVHDEKLLLALARLAVPDLADVCTLHLVDESGRVRRAAWAAVDARSEDLLAALEHAQPGGTDLVRRALVDGRVRVLVDLSARDLSATDPATAIVHELGLRSALVVPFRGDERVVGVMVFAYGPSQRTYRAEDLALGEELARRAAIALESLRLLGLEKEARRRFELLADAARLATRSAGAPDRLARELTELLSRVVGDACVLRFSTAGAEALETAAVAHPRPQAAALLHELFPRAAQPIGEGPSAQALRSGTPVVHEVRSAQDPSVVPVAGMTRYLESFGVASVLHVPLQARGQPLGLLSLWRDGGRPQYSAQDRDVVVQVADRAAAAVEAVRLRDAEQAALWQLEAAVARARRLQAVATALSAALSPSQVARVVVDEGLAAMGARGGAIALADEGSGELAAVASRGYASDEEAGGGRFPLVAERPLMVAVRTGQPLYVPTPEEFERRFGDVEGGLRSVGDEALLAAPLVFEGRVLGALTMTFAQPRLFTDEDRTLVEALTAQCAQAIERARLFEHEKRSRERLAFLAQAASLLGSSLDYRATLERVAGLAVPALGDLCSFLLLEEGRLRPVATAHVDPSLARRAQEACEALARGEGGGLERALRGGGPLLLELRDLLGSDPEGAEPLRGLGLRTTMAVPLFVRGRGLGVLLFLSSSLRQRSGASDLETAEELARSAAAAVDNALLYADAQAAVSLRDSFLSIAGHELRTPLTALKLQLQLLRRLQRGPQHDAMRLAEASAGSLRQADRLERLINELLDVSRIAAGRLCLDYEELDLGDVAAEVCARFSDEVARAGSVLTLGPQQAVMGAWDKARIDQVLTNLLSNAIKYGKGAPISVSVSRSGERAILTVRDHGIGIAREDQQRIFDRFERAVSDRQYGGLGLGLWIVRQIVDAHGGNVRLYSAPGSGTSFVVELPLRPAG